MKAELLPTLNPLANIFLNLPAKQTNSSTQASLGKLPSGAKTIGNYLLGKNIGEGTFGKVHLALHLPTSEKVAVKIIDKSKMRPKDVQRVLTEIEVLKKIRHRHVVTLYEIIETEKSLLLVTEFLPNGELFRHIIKEKRIAEDEACTYFQQIVEAIDYLHRNKIAHRDLKPENILIDYDKQLKIIDFGLSAVYKGKEKLQTFCGSPCYAAPEMVEAKQSYNPLQVDLWSCGVVLFAMLCGHLPFCDVDTHTLFKKILACTYKIPTHVSPDAQDLIQRLLVLEPEKRISIEEIREHKWFNRVSPAAAYGIDLGQQLPADNSVLERLKSMGISEQKMQEDVLANQKNRDMATYLILMKKLVRNGDLVPSYLGNDNFNPKLIIREEKIPDEQDTESYHDPDSDQVYIKAPEAPKMPNIEDIVGPLAGSMDWFSEEEVKDIDEGELMLLAGGILDLFLPKTSQPKPAINHINEVFSQIESGHPMRRMALEKRESEFYSHNKALAKKQFTLPGVNKLKGLRPFDISTTASIYRKKMRSSICEKATLNPGIKRSTSRRKKTEPSSIANSEQMIDSRLPSFLKRNDARLSSQLEKKQIALPNLPTRIESVNPETKANYIAKKYKAFKNFLH